MEERGQSKNESRGQLVVAIDNSVVNVGMD